MLERDERDGGTVDKIGAVLAKDHQADSFGALPRAFV